MYTYLVNPLQQLWDSLVQFVPGLAGAILVLIVGYLIASVVGSAVQRVLDKTKAEKWVMKKTHLRKLMGNFRMNHFLGLIIKWWVFVLFFAPAASLVKLTTLSGFLVSLGAWIPNLIAAIVMVFLGLVAADYVSIKIRSTKGKGAEFFASLAKVGILIYVILIALEQVGLMVALATNSFLIVLTGVVFALSLAFGLAFGLGMQKEANKWYNQLKRRL